MQSASPPSQDGFPAPSHPQLLFILVQSTFLQKRVWKGSSPSIPGLIPHVRTIFPTGFQHVSSTGRKIWILDLYSLETAIGKSERQVSEHIRRFEFFLTFRVLT